VNTTTQDKAKEQACETELIFTTICNNFNFIGIDGCQFTVLLVSVESMLTPT
jgi:hypothetical protein